jgi:hypothetical protein
LFNPTRGVLIKFKKKLPWKPRYQNNGVGWRLLLICNGNSSYYITPTAVGWCIAILRFFFTINPPFSFPWQLRQSLSKRLRFFWSISFN